MKKRNPYALAALSRKAHRQKDRKKEANKKACRGKKRHARIAHAGT
jgi:hypothetical protein